MAATCDNGERAAGLKSHRLQGSVVEVVGAEKRKLCIEFRNQDEFKFKPEQAEIGVWADGHPGICWWLLWKAGPAAPEQSAWRTRAHYNRWEPTWHHV
jgi:hypothetical protein